MVMNWGLKLKQNSWKSILVQVFVDKKALLEKMFAGVDVRRRNCGEKFCCGFMFAAGSSVRNTKGAVGDKIQARELETAHKERGRPAFE